MKCLTPNFHSRGREHQRFASSSIPEKVKFYYSVWKPRDHELLRGRVWSNLSGTLVSHLPNLNSRPPWRWLRPPQMLKPTQLSFQQMSSLHTTINKNWKRKLLWYPPSPSKFSLDTARERAPDLWQFHLKTCSEMRKRSDSSRDPQPHDTKDCTQTR